MNRSTRNRLFKALLIKAGFTIEPAAEASPTVAQVRKNTHQHLCGMHLADHRDMIQVGTCERDAKVYRRSDLPQISSVRYAKDGNAKVWLLAPGAAYVATGYGFHLGQFVHLAEEEHEKRKAMKEKQLQTREK